MARRRLLQLDSAREVENINKVLNAFRSRTGRCINSWAEIAPAFHAVGLRMDATGTPLDPTNVPYRLMVEACSVELAPQSEIPKH